MHVRGSWGRRGGVQLVPLTFSNNYESKDKSGENGTMRLNTEPTAIVLSMLGKGKGGHDPFLKKVTV